MVDVEGARRAPHRTPYALFYLHTAAHVRLTPVPYLLRYPRATRAYLSYYVVRGGRWHSWMIHFVIPGQFVGCGGQWANVYSNHAWRPYPHIAISTRGV